MRQHGQAPTQKIPIALYHGHRLSARITPLGPLQWRQEVKQKPLPLKKSQKEDDEMTLSKKQKLLNEISQRMPPVIYATDDNGTVVCMVCATSHSHVVEHGTASDLNDLWRATPAQRAAGAAALRYGWLHPDADPRNYNDKGERIYVSNEQSKPRKKKAPAERP